MNVQSIGKLEELMSVNTSPIGTMFFCGDGVKEEWETQYPAISIITSFIAERVEGQMFPVAKGFSGCNIEINGKFLKITPAIPSGVLVQVDYTFEL